MSIHLLNNLVWELFGKLDGKINKALYHQGKLNLLFLKKALDMVMKAGMKKEMRVSMLKWMHLKLDFKKLQKRYELNSKYSKYCHGLY